MIFTFSGRKRSGKGVLTKILTDRGARSVSMAGWMKRTSSDLFGITLEDLDARKIARLALPPIKPDRLDALLQVEPILEPFRDDLLNRSGQDARVFLQEFGTEICRKADPEFHTKKAFEEIDRLETVGPVVSDDVRFQNEIELRAKGSHSFFVVSPWNWEISNHPSENSLLWSDFPKTHIIFNDQKLPAFIKRYNAFFDHFLQHGPPWNNTMVRTIFDLLNEGRSSTEVAKKLGCSRSKIVWWAALSNYRLRFTKYISNDRAFLDPTPETAYWAGFFTADGCIKRQSAAPSLLYVLSFCSTDREAVEGFKTFCGSNRPVYVEPGRVSIFPGGKESLCKDSYKIQVYNPLILENLKLWNLKPRKSCQEEIPYMVEKHPELFYPWLRGFIDGDGGVYKVKEGRFDRVFVASSKGIIDWIEKTVALPSSVWRHPRVENFYTLQYFHRSSQELKKRLDGYPRLERKWATS